MTALGRILRARLARTGPISIADYMSECLLHPEHGYYATRDPLGASGDFTTAPEISQMFGELLGLALAQAWLDQGQPSGVLAELGPGRGTLMADILRATRGVPGFHSALRPWLVEASPVLRARQADTLGQVNWADRVEDLPPGPLFLVANEFFDALPIRQFQRHASGWAERQIGVSEGALAFGFAPPAPLAALAHRLEDTRPGELVETAAPASAIAACIGRRIAEAGGAALIVDYGGWRSRGDTLQAVRAHRPEDPLASPGEVDLTAHVDFEALAQALRPAAVTGMTSQGVLLERLGITARAQALAKGLSGEALESHIKAHRRLTHPDEMGTVFKGIAAFPRGQTAPAGFDP